jgi:uncharacterized protein
MSPFLTARWEDLVILNYEAPRELLAPLVPAGTELDDWHGQMLVSLVGFLFKDTKVRGVPIPRHRNFEEVNLRFYVRRRDEDGEWRRAVVFIRELVPRFAIAGVARRMYNEPYLCVPMAHNHDRARGRFEYRWRYTSEDFALRAEVSGEPQPFEPGSEAEFITEHYWGYTRQKDGGTIEYLVEHPSWRVWTPHVAGFDGAERDMYGPAWDEILASPPRSAFVAEGSPVAVYEGERLE